MTPIEMVEAVRKERFDVRYVDLHQDGGFFFQTHIKDLADYIVAWAEEKGYKKVDQYKVFAAWVTHMVEKDVPGSGAKPQP